MGELTMRRALALGAVAAACGAGAALLNNRLVLGIVFVAGAFAAAGISAARPTRSRFPTGRQPSWLSLDRPIRFVAGAVVVVAPIVFLAVFSGGPLEGELWPSLALATGIGAGV